MKLKHKEALEILNIKIEDIVSEEGSVGARVNLIKSMYRKACSQYHPDRNPAGLEMMKLVNLAFESLADVINGGQFDYSVKADNVSSANVDLGEELNKALNAVIGLGLKIEICGSWIWVSGDTKPHKEVLKAAGYRWAPKKLMWSFCGGSRTSSRGKFSMDDIRLRHGSVYVKPEDKKRIAA
jgi:curved DNA-binding protein CbpA